MLSIKVVIESFLTASLLIGTLFFGSGAAASAREYFSPRLVFYAFEKNDGMQGTCMGVSFGPKQFLTSRHCVDNISNPKKDIIIATHNAGPVESVQLIEGADAAVVTMTEAQFQEGCTPLNDTTVPIGEILDLYRIDESSGGLRIEQLVVEDNDYRVFNTDIPAYLDDVLLTSPVSGVPSHEGDSGAPILYEDKDGTYMISGILMGLSVNTGYILVEPTNKFVDQIVCVLF